MIDRLFRIWGPTAVIVAGVLLLVIVLTITSALRAGPIDATDPPDGRSGMGLRTDHETGCEYLIGERGGITPRLNAAGRHMGCRG